MNLDKKNSIKKHINRINRLKKTIKKIRKKIMIGGDTNSRIIKLEEQNYNDELHKKYSTKKN